MTQDNDPSSRSRTADDAVGQGWSGEFSGWRMVGLAFLAQNAAYGFTYGAYGTFITPVGKEFAASRTVTSAGLAIVSLLLGLLGPVVGHLVERFSVRRVMACGLLLLSCAYLAAASARSAWQFALAVGVLGGLAYLFDVTGSYERVFAIHAAMFTVAAGIFALIARFERRRARPSAARFSSA